MFIFIAVVLQPADYLDFYTGALARCLTFTESFSALAFNDMNGSKPFFLKPLFTGLKLRCKK